MPGPWTVPVAVSTPFNNSTNGFVATNVQAAIEEVKNISSIRSRAILLAYATAIPSWMRIFGNYTCDGAPYIFPVTGTLKDITITGSANSPEANQMISFYIVNVGITYPLTPTLGTLATATNQGLTWYEGDFPYTGTTRISVSLVNNGASKPLTFSENTTAKTVTVQLATNASSVITTTATELRNAFRTNSTITQIYKITGSGNTALTTASFTCSGGAAGDVAAAIFCRASSLYAAKSNVNKNAAVGQALLFRAYDNDVAGMNPVLGSANIIFPAE
jgi:hypothetical protein